MFYLFAALICVILCTMILWSFVDLSINYGFKQTLKAKWSIVVLVIGIGLGVAAILLYREHIKKVESNAIDHYVVGDYELQETMLDGKLVDWQYLITPADYD